MKNAKLSRRDFLRWGAVAAAGIAVAACKPKETEAPVAQQPEEVELDLWGWWEPRMNLYQMAGDSFTEQNPEIKVVVTTLPGGELVEKTYSAAAAGTGPNMLKMGEFYFQMKPEGLLVRFPEDIFPHSWYEEAYPSVYWPAYEGYVVPTGTDCSVLYYNKKMFEEAGLDPESPPKTWAQSVEAGKALTKRESSGLLTVAGLMPPSELAAWDQAYQLGGNLVSHDDPPKATVNTEEWVKAWEFIYDMYYEHKTTDVGFTGAIDAIGTGLCAMASELTWVIGEFQGTYAEVWPDMGIAPPPTPTGEPDPWYGWKNSVLSICALTGKPDEYPATFEFLGFLYKEGGRDAYREIIKLLGIAPVRADLYDDPEILSMPGMKDVVLKVEPLEVDAVNRPEDFMDFWDGDLRYRIIEQQESIQAVLDDANARLQQIIDDGLAEGIA
jgi:ABC-type glycerol-3-phosphate transport system substrate-binding protein